MPNDGFVQVAPDSTGKKLDTSEVTTSQGVVERERVVIADDANAQAVAPVQATRPSEGTYGLPVRAVPDEADTQVVLLRQIVRLLKIVSFQLSFLNTPRLDMLNMDPSMFDEDKVQV